MTIFPIFRRITGLFVIVLSSWKTSNWRDDVNLEHIRVWVIGGTPQMESPRLGRENKGSFEGPVSFTKLAK